MLLTTAAFALVQRPDNDGMGMCLCIDKVCTGIFAELSPFLSTHLYLPTCKGFLSVHLQRFGSAKTDVE